MPKDPSLEIAKKKLLAIERAKRRLKNRLADIDWDYEYLQPLLKELDDSAQQGEIPEYTIEDD